MLSYTIKRVGLAFVILLTVMVAMYAMVLAPTTSSAASGC